MRYELSDYAWAAIKPMLPNKPRGVRRVNDRRGGARREPGPDVRGQRRHAAAE
jgi:transposase